MVKITLSPVEKENRESIRQECLSYRTNFRGIDILIKYEDDWHVAGQEGNYDFSNCPHSYEETFSEEIHRNMLPEICSQPNDFNSVADECRECWRQALNLEKPIRRV